MQFLKKLIAVIRVNSLKSQLKMIDQASKPALLIGSPLYCNIGDLTIAEAEHLFWGKNFQDYDLIDIPRELWLSYKASIVNRVDDKCPILITGGGFIGDIWLDEQEFIEDVIETFSKNTIIFFPQTFFFKELRRFEVFIKKLKKANKVLLFARDKNSFFQMRKYESINIKVMLVPDIVLSIEPELKIERNNECVLCFRNDTEKVTEDSMIVNIIDYLNAKDINYKKYSTVYPKYVSLKDRKNRVKQAIKVFSGSNMVITDRLHGLILATISGTPVLFFDNLSKKVSLTYDFLRSIDIICDYNNYVSLYNALNDLCQKKPKKYSNKYVINYYREMKNVIENYIQ